MNVVAGIAVLLLACAGNAELWVILMNRVHSRCFGHRTLRRIRYFHDAGMLLFPPFLITFAGLIPNGLLRGGTVADLRPELQAILAVTFCGLVPLLISVARWQFSRDPRRLLETTTEHFDVLRMADSTTQRDLVIGDTSGWLWKFPWNQIYHLDANRKCIEIRCRPGAAIHGGRRMLKLAHFSDTHLIGCPGNGFYQFVTKALCRMKPDAFVFTGDLIDQQELLPWAIEAFRQMAEVAPAFFILGNHDQNLDHAAIRQALVSTGWQDVGEKCFAVTLGDTEVLLAGTEAPWIGDDPEVPERSENQLRLLLSHSPDQRDFAVANDFDLMLCGHLHGGQVILPVIGPVYSPSKYGVMYSGGLYECGDLLIHVSRGVGAMDTLRWNCPPEISLLELHIMTPTQESDTLAAVNAVPVTV